MKRAYFLTTTFAMLLSCAPLSATEDVYREGLRYIQGSGVQKDKKKAAAAGNKAASKSLRELEESAKKDAKKDVRKSAKKSGSEDASISWSVSPGAEAEYLKGLKLMGDSNSFQEARSHIEAAAEQGYAEAQYELGCWYMSGHRLEKSETKAVEWYKKAAELGDSRAQYALGMYYKVGKVVPKDVKKAAQWLRKAASNGNREALEAFLELED